MQHESVDFEELLSESLKDPQVATAYLNAHLEDAEDDNGVMFLNALNRVIRIHGATYIAEKANLIRESMYKSFSDKGNPTLRMLIPVLSALGLKLSIDSKTEPNDEWEIGPFATQNFFFAAEPCDTPIQVCAPSGAQAFIEEYIQVNGVDATLYMLAKADLVS